MFWNIISLIQRDYLGGKVHFLQNLVLMSCYSQLCTHSQSLPITRCLKLNCSATFSSSDSELSFFDFYFVVFLVFDTSNAPSVFSSSSSAERFFVPENLIYLPPLRAEDHVPFVDLVYAFRTLHKNSFLWKLFLCQQAPYIVYIQNLVHK